MFRFLVHYGIHFIVPLMIAYCFYRKEIIKAGVILLGGILIDIDHLWADPIFSSERCSINFHLFHTYPFIAIYLILLLFRSTRLMGLAFTIHIIADTMDCIFLSHDPWNF